MRETRILGNISLGTVREIVPASSLGAHGNNPIAVIEISELNEAWVPADGIELTSGMSVALQQITIEKEGFAGKSVILDIIPIAS